MTQPSIVLASSSIYRKALLDKLKMPFHAISPICDETALANESPAKLVSRLAKLKAISSASIFTAQHPQKECVSIGSDQVCVIGEEILGKPHTIENAVNQLTKLSGQFARFYTSLAIYQSASQTIEIELDYYDVHFKSLSQAQIQAYIQKEMPLDCAGSFKSEGLGIALFEKLTGRDPNTLVGLPLILLIDMLKKHNIDPLTF